MELYGRSNARSGLQQNRSVEWSLARQETGLEESMSRLGLRGREAYPEKPGVSECAYYMRTGLCGYGAKCRYNHPRDRASVSSPDHGPYLSPDLLIRKLEQVMETVVVILQPGPVGIIEHKFSAEEICNANATVKMAVENWRRSAQVEQHSPIFKEFLDN